jgi:hypothetical protein
MGEKPPLFGEDFNMPGWDWKLNMGKEKYLGGALPGRRNAKGQSGTPKG